MIARDLSIRPYGGGFNFVTHPRRSRGWSIGRLAITELTSAISTLDRVSIDTRGGEGERGLRPIGRKRSMVAGKLD